MYGMLSVYEVNTVLYVEFISPFYVQRNVCKSRKLLKVFLLFPLVTQPYAVTSRSAGPLLWALHTANPVGWGKAGSLSPYQPGSRSTITGVQEASWQLRILQATLKLLSFVGKVYLSSFLVASLEIINDSVPGL